MPGTSAMAGAKENLLMDGLRDLGNGLVKLGQFFLASAEARGTGSSPAATAPVPPPPKSARAPLAATARANAQKRAREKATSSTAGVSGAARVPKGADVNALASDIVMVDPSEQTAPVEKAPLIGKKAPASKLTPGAKAAPVTKATPAAKGTPAEKPTPAAKDPGSAKPTDGRKPVSDKKTTAKATKARAEIRRAVDADLSSPRAKNAIASKSVAPKSPTEKAVPSSPPAKNTDAPKSAGSKSPVVKAALSKSASAASKPKAISRQRKSVKAQALAVDAARMEAHLEKGQGNELEEDSDSSDESYMSESVSESVSESESDIRSVSESEGEGEDGAEENDEVASPRTPPVPLKPLGIVGRKRNRIAEDDEKNDEGATTKDVKKSVVANGKGTKRKRMDADTGEKLRKVLTDIVKQNPNWAVAQIVKETASMTALDVSENQCKLALRRLVANGVLSGSKGRRGYVVVEKTSEGKKGRRSSSMTSPSPTMKSMGAKSPKKKASPGTKGKAGGSTV